MVANDPDFLMKHHMMIISHLPAALCTLFVMLSVSVLPSVQAEENFNPTDNWVATDALGRKLPSHSEVGDRKSEKTVGVFYFVWVGNHTRQVYDISKILKNKEEDRTWGPVKATHF
jgi:hypothetical protein